jgi:hypothetical protein
MELRIVMLGLSLVGCAAGEGAAARSDSGAASDLGADGDDGGGEGAAGAGLWWTLGAALTLVDGAPVPAAGALDLRVLDDAGVELCAAAVAIEDVRAISPPEPVILGWWELSLGPWEPTCTGAQAARPMGEALTLGVGELHPEVAALLPAQDGLPAAAGDRLNGAYAQLSADEAPVAFGIAGPAEAFAGEAGPWTEAPLPDSALAIQAVYRFASPAR